jgi:hypothetical protein
MREIDRRLRHDGLISLAPYGVPDPADGRAAFAALTRPGLVAGFPAEWDGTHG